MRKSGQNRNRNRNTYIGGTQLLFYPFLKETPSNTFNGFRSLIGIKRDIIEVQS